MDISHNDEFWVVNWSTDCEGRCASIDPQWQGITGQTAEHALGGGWLAAVHQDDREQARAELESARSSERSFRIVARLRRADGQFRWAMAVGAPRYDAQGAYVGHCGSIIDFHERIIAERGPAETPHESDAVASAAPTGLRHPTERICDADRKSDLEALSASQERYRSLFETSRDGIVTVDMAGHILEANPAYQEMLGYTLDELKRLTYQELTPEVWRDMEAAIVREHILPRGVSPEYEKEYIRKDGTRFPISLRTWTVVDDKGRIVGMRAFVRDITERKQAEAALRASERRFRAIFDQQYQYSALLSADGRVIEVSESVIRGTGVAREELAGRPFLDGPWWRNFPDVRARLQAQFDAARVRAGPSHGEGAYETRDGAQRYAVNTVIALRDERGDIEFLLVEGIDITERKQVEEALRQSESRFRQVAESLPQLVWTCAADGRCDYLSPQWVRYTGKSEAEQLGYGWLDHVHPDDRKQVVDEWRITTREGRQFDTEFRIRRHDGTYRWFRTLASPLRDETGQLVKWFGSNTDIDDLKSAELALRESRQQLALALEAGQLGFWDWDVPSGRVEFGGCWASMLGYEPSEIEPHVRAWERLVHPDEREEVAAKVAAHLEGWTEFYECEHRLRHKDGSWRWILDRGQVVERDGEGRPLRAIGTHADVTARHEAEAAVRDSEERFRMSFANASIGFAMNGPDYRFLDANPAYCALTGYSLEELRAHKGSELIHPDDRPANEAFVERMAAGEIPGFVIENRYVRKTGEHIWVRKSVSLIRGADGAPRWLITLVEDVTERKQAEEALRQSRNDLDRAQEVAKIGWWRLDVRRNVLTWSDENYRIFGVPKGTPLSYDNFLAMVHPDERAYVDAQWRAALRGEPYDIEHRIVCGGDVKWVREKAYLEFDGAGALLGGFGITHDLTERKLVEEKLKESELRYRTLVEAASAVAWRCPPSGLHVEPQPEWMAFTGQTAEEMLGDGWSKAIHPDDLAQAASKWREAVARGALFENEHRIRRRDGQWRWMSVQVAPVHDAKGEIVEWFGMNIDITERKQAEERLRASEETLLNAQRSARAGVWEIDLIANRVAWSEPYYELSGLPHSVQPSYENWIASIHPDDRPRVEAEYARSLEARGAQQIEFRIIRDGRIRWLHREGRVICDDAGRPLRVAGITWDITERKRAEEALLWHMRRSELLSETAAQLLASEDPQRLADELCTKVMTFLDCDLFFNYLVDEEAGRLRLNACAGVSGERTPSFEWLDLDAAVCGCVASRRERIIAEDIQNGGDPRTELVKSLGIQAYCCHPLLHQDRVIGTLSFGARSRAHFNVDEIAVMKAVTDLVAIAMRRGETEQALREADRRKDEFLATLAHELRNPLAPIQNALHILRKKYGPEYPDALLLDMMQRQVGHLIRLVEDLLEVSRISRGKIELRKEFVVLQTILSDALETSQPLIDKKAHHVIANMPDEPIWLFGDPVRLTQIVANIVNNAAKYTPPGGRIEIEAEREGDKIVLRVRDNGVGISGEMMPRVFDLFAQTEGQIRLSEGGLGIGLALVRSLVELHGGRVHARSAGVGRGSEFSVTLPLAHPDGAKWSDS